MCVKSKDRVKNKPHYYFCDWGTPSMFHQKTFREMETKILKSGQRSDGSYWVLVQKEEGDFLLTALIATKTAKTAGDKLVIPAGIAKNMDWK